LGAGTGRDPRFDAPLASLHDPTPDHATPPWEPPSAPDLRTAHRCQVERTPPRVPRLSPSASHPPRPARRDPHGPLASATRARCHAQEPGRGLRQARGGGAAPSPAKGWHHPLLRPGVPGERVSWGTGRLVPRSRRPGNVSHPVRCLPVAWRHTRLAAAHLHALEERRPAWGGAPCRGAMPSQERQGLLARAGPSGVLPPAPLAPNAKSVSERIWEMSHHVRSNPAHRSHACVSSSLTCQEVVRLSHGYNACQTSHHVRPNTLAIP